MPSLRTLWCIFALLAILVVPRLVRAQDNPNFEIGLKPYGSYHAGNIDNVSLGNGSLGVDIPLISYPQRGGKLKLDFSLHYFNASSSGSWYCYPGGSCTWVPNGSYAAFLLIDEQALTKGNGLGCCTANTSPTYCTLDPNSNALCYFQVQNADGASHIYNPSNTTSTAYRTIDGASILATGSTNSGATTFVDSGGITHTNVTFSANGLAHYPAILSDTREDSNGNEITFSSSSGWTDTMGRSIPLPVKSTNSSDFAGCTGVQPIAFVYLWSPPGINGGTYPLKLCYSSATAYTPSPLTSVVLPDGTAWTLQYASSRAQIPTQNLAQVTFPSGGTLSYTWTETTICGGGSSVSLNETVATRIMNPNDGVTPASQWNYAWSSGIVGTTTVTDPMGNASVYVFGAGVAPGTAAPCNGLYENQAKYYQGSNTSGTLLKTVNTTYLTAGGYYPPSPGGSPAWLPIQIDTIWPNGQQARVAHSYDSGFTVYYPFYPFNGSCCNPNQTTSALYGKQLTTQEYDYGNGAAGSLLRTTTNTYLALNNPTYLGYNLLDLPSSVKITDGGGTQRAYTTYSYDQFTLGTPGITTQHVTPPNGSYRGNLSSTARWLNGSTTATTNCNISVSNGYLTDYKTYNDTGTVATAVDSCGTSSSDPSHLTSNTYSATYVGAFLTTQTTPPTPNVPVGLSTIYAYDFNTGLQTSVTDPNSRVKQLHYDNMLRTTEIDLPDGGQTTFNYPSPNEIDISEKIDATPRYKTASLLVDGVGREIRRIISNGESAPYDQADTYYNFNSSGHYNFRSYPYQGSGFSTARLTSGVGDTTSYDALNRTATIAHSDGSSILTSYTARATSVQDEGNGTQRVQRISQVDGLGRLASVCEVSSNLTVGISGSQSAAPCGQDIGGTGFLTTYAYDALDNLTAVAQGPLNARSFIYDSLSRLNSSTNPEAGTTTYTYDADSNVLTKKDARNITITYTYDQLNRLTGKTYSDTTPAVTYSYDQSSALGVTLTNTIGRRSSESTASPNPTGSVFSYDPVGRVVNNSQCTPQNCPGTTFSFTYNYDLLGDTTYNVWGLGLNLTYSYNLGARLTQVVSSANDAQHPPTLFSIAHYNAAGSLVSASLGNGISESRTYDGRLRLTGITDGSVYTLTIPTTGGYAPNSDILAANDNVNGNWTYAYDQFNRLATSSANSGATTYGYLYDRFGNRWQQNVTHGTGTPSNLGFDASNHITATYGVTYDAAGDTSSDGTTNYTYDAEGRVITAVNGLSGSSSYVYDAEGRRVRKTTVAGGAVDFLYDLSGYQIDSVTSTGAWTRGEVYAGGRHLVSYLSSPMTYFIYADWLGTERVRSPYVAGTNETCTGLPFGDALSCAGGTDVSPMHFTGKEHDSETGLENFGARYDSSAMGRFISPDSPSYSNHKNPQTWNLYAYSLNNPATFRDADGHKIACANSVQQCQTDAAAATANAEAAKRVTTQTTTTKHSFLGFHWTTSETQIAIKGDIKSFAALSPNAAKLAALVTDSRTVTVSYDQTARASSWDTGFSLHGGSTSFMNPFLAIIDPTRTPGAVYDQDAVDQGIPQANTGEEFAHEVLGHIWGDMLGGAPAGSRANMRDSIESEDAVRKLDPTRGQKGIESHHNYDELPADLPKSK